MVRHNVLAAILILLMTHAPVGHAAGACVMPGAILLGERDGLLAGIDLEGNDVILPEPMSASGRRWWGHPTSRSPAMPRWTVDRQAGEGSVTMTVVDTSDGRVVVSQSFASRIELAASAVSASHRFTVYLQGNNIASEVTVLDAREGTSRLVRLRHDADLAPYAIAFAFSPGETCLAIALERVGGMGPELWLVPLAGGEPRFLDPRGLWVERWRPGSG